MINYLFGDATNPEIDGAKVMVHICNDIGGWGRGFVLALSEKWQEPEAAYRVWHKEGKPVDFQLGNVIFVQVEPDIWIANLIGQSGIKAKNGVPPIRYEAVKAGLQQVAQFAQISNASIHMPRIGCGLAGGNWNKIEKIINEVIISQKIEVYVYDLPY